MKIYNYGARTPDNLELVIRQYELRHKYRNKLVEIERNRRVATEAKRRELFPEYDAIVQELKSLDDQVAEMRSRMKRVNAQEKKRVPQANLKAQIKSTEERRKAMREREKQQRSRINGVWDHKNKQWKVAPDPVWDEFRIELWNDAYGNDEWSESSGRPSKAKAAYNADEFADLFWATKLVVGAEVTRTNDVRIAMPKFKSWSGGEGRIAVQIQSSKSLSTEQVKGDDNRLRLKFGNNVAASPKAMPINPNSKRQQKYTVWLRIGSNGREPLWTKVPILLHRPLPEGQIKWAWLLRKKVGTHFSWSFQFVVDERTGEAEERIGGAVGIDVGWRMVPEGLRVAYWVGDDGNEGEVVIPQRRLDDILANRQLQSERDKQFDDMKAHLSEWLSAHENELPKWLVDHSAFLGQWRSAARLAALTIMWRHNRFEGDEAIFVALEGWRRQDRKDYDRFSFVEMGFNNWRNKQFFRETCKRLVEQFGYARAAIEDTNWSELARTPEPDKASDAEVSIFYRKLASCGRFAETLKSYFQVTKVKAAGSTEECHNCGAACVFDRKELVRTCAECGDKCDQDRNAAIVLLKRLASAEVVKE